MAYEAPVSRPGGRYPRSPVSVYATEERALCKLSVSGGIGGMRKFNMSNENTGFPFILHHLTLCIGLD